MNRKRILIGEISIVPSINKGSKRSRGKFLNSFITYFKKDFSVMLKKACEDGAQFKSPTMTDISKLASKAWVKLSPEAKMYYSSKAEKNKRAFNTKDYDNLICFENVVSDDIIKRELEALVGEAYRNYEKDCKNSEKAIE
ncbi:11940_t:CDS:1, partial [Acaulospora morrowiae]